MPQIAGLRGVLPQPSKVKQVIDAFAGPQGGDVAKGLAAGSLVRDPARAVYRYHQAFSEPGSGRTLVRKLVLCAVRLEPWSEGLIRPHEATLPAQQAAALAALQATKTMTPPVLAAYRDAAGEVERVFRRTDNDPMTFEVTTADHTQHRLWRVTNAELFGQLKRALAPKKLKVLDGHDRYEAALAYRDQLAAQQPLAQYSSANYTLMALVNLDDPTLWVAARHRVLRGVPKSDVVLAAARKYFIVDKLAGAAKDLARQQAALDEQLAHQPAVIVSWANEPDAWKLTLSPDVSPVDEGVQAARAVQKFDPIIADALLIERAMPGAKVETVIRAEDALAAKADAVVLLRPLSIEQIAHLSDLGQLLPPGSTAFVPRIAPGLIAQPIDPDEDLV